MDVDADDSDSHGAMDYSYQGPAIYLVGHF